MRRFLRGRPRAPLSAGARRADRGGAPSADKATGVAGDGPDALLAGEGQAPQLRRIGFKGSLPARGVPTRTPAMSIPNPPLLRVTPLCE